MMNRRQRRLVNRSKDVDAKYAAKLGMAFYNLTDLRDAIGKRLGCLALGQRNARAALTMMHDQYRAKELTPQTAAKYRKVRRDFARNKGRIAAFVDVSRAIDLILKGKSSLEASFSIRAGVKPFDSKAAEKKRRREAAAAERQKRQREVAASAR